MQTPFTTTHAKLRIFISEWMVIILNLRCHHRSQIDMTVIVEHSHAHVESSQLENVRKSKLFIHLVIESEPGHSLFCLYRLELSSVFFISVMLKF